MKEFMKRVQEAWNWSYPIDVSNDKNPESSLEQVKSVSAIIDKFI